MKNSILSYLQPPRRRNEPRDRLNYVKVRLPDGCEARRCVFGLRCSNLTCIRSQMGHSSRPAGEPWNPFYDCPRLPDEDALPRSISYFFPSSKSAPNPYFRRPSP